jgi:hypothetical protein
MFQEEVPASSRGPEQVWFSMIMVNDPNAALFGSLRPSRPHPIVAALRRPFERHAPTAPRPVHEVDEPALRPRRSRWISAALAAGLVALGFGLTETVLEQVTAKDSHAVVTATPARIGSTTLAALPAPQPTAAGAAASAAGGGTTLVSVASAAAPVAAARESRGTSPIAASVARDPESSARARAPEAAPAKQARSSTSVKKKASARQRKAAFGRALAARKSARR